jgi:hypothetical protein
VTKRVVKDLHTDFTSARRGDNDGLIL